jgi:hypothetical protein
MTEGFCNIITQLEGQRAAIDKALAALRDVNGTESSAAEAAVGAELVPSAHAMRKGRMSPAGKKRLSAAVKKRWATKRTVENPSVVRAPITRPRNAAQGKGRPTKQGRSKELKEGTMKARTVELLRKAAKPMESGEVAKRMKIGSGYASVNLSQLRRDGFLTHTPEGYIVG